MTPLPDNATELPDRHSHFSVAARKVINATSAGATDTADLQGHHRIEEIARRIPHHVGAADGDEMLGRLTGLLGISRG